MVFVCSFMFPGNLFMCIYFQWISGIFTLPLSQKWLQGYHFTWSVQQPEEQWAALLLCITITSNAVCERLQGLSLESEAFCVGAERSLDSNSVAYSIVVWLVLSLSVVPSLTFVYTGIWCFFGKSDTIRKRSGGIEMKLIIIPTDRKQSQLWFTCWEGL